MKKLITLVVAGCMVLGALGTAAAVDVKIGGRYQFAWGYVSNNTLVKAGDTGKHQDRIRARHRMNVVTEFIADENLKGVLNIEIGDMVWGNGGGRLDADATDQLKLKHSYVDWTLPSTQVKTRIGLQPIAMPYIAGSSNPVMNADVAGITVSNQFTPELGLTVFWARPYDSNAYSTESDGKNKMDEMDLFGFMLPIKTDFVRATPWAMLAIIGKDSGYYQDKAGAAYTDKGIARYKGKDGGSYGGYGRAALRADKMDSTGYAWWLGSTFELPILDPFFVKLDAMMGGLDNGDSDSDAFGYFLAADIGYKFNWGKLSAFGWYSSGDKDVDDRGIMPIVSDDTGFAMTSYAQQGKYSRGWDSALSYSGLGMWGVGLKLADMSFVDKLKHTARIAWMGGTNSRDGWSSEKYPNARPDAHSASWHYLFTDDRAYEIDLLTQYQVTKELEIGLNLSYLWLDLGKSWKNDDDTKGSFNATVGLQYRF